MKYLSIKQLSEYIPYSCATIKTYIWSGEFQQITEEGGPGEYLKLKNTPVFLQDRIDLWVLKRAGLKAQPETDRLGLKLARGGRS